MVFIDLEFNKLSVSTIGKQRMLTSHGADVIILILHFDAQNGKAVISRIIERRT